MSKHEVAQVLWKIALYALLTIAAIAILFPLYTGFVTSLLSAKNLDTYPPKLIPLDA